MPRSVSSPKGLNSYKHELGIRTKICSRTGRSGREEEEEQVGEPQYKREREDKDCKYVAILLADGSTDVQPLKGKLDFPHAKRLAVCGSKREAEQHAKDWVS